MMDAAACNAAFAEFVSHVCDIQLEFDDMNGVRKMYPIILKKDMPPNRKTVAGVIGRFFHALVVDGIAFETRPLTKGEGSGDGFTMVQRKKPIATELKQSTFERDMYVLLLCLFGDGQLESRFESEKRAKTIIESLDTSIHRYGNAHADRVMIELKNALGNRYAKKTV